MDGRLLLLHCLFSVLSLLIDLMRLCGRGRRVVILGGFVVR